MHSLYDEQGGDGFTAFVNTLRCRAVNEGRRCQLYADHDGPHASSHMPHRRPLDSTTWEWADGGPLRVVGNPEPRRWCAFQAD